MIQKYGKEKANEIIEYSYNNSTDPTKEVMPPTPPPSRQSKIQSRQNIQQPNIQQSNIQQSNIQQSNIQQQLNKIQQYNESLRNVNSNQRIYPQNVNKFSPAYARIIAAKPKATSSANIRLGGVY